MAIYRTVALILLLAASLRAQDFTPKDDVKANPARFRQVVWDYTFTVPDTGKYTLVFPTNISTYRMPSCELVNADTKKPATLQWTKVERDKLAFTAPAGERIQVHCIGLEMKPWRVTK